MNTEDAIQAAVDRIVSGYNLALEKAVSSARAKAHRAGMLAGLKEAAGIAIDQAKAADEMLNAARDERDRVGGLVHSAEAAEGRLIAKSIRARIAEIEAEDKAP